MPKPGFINNDKEHHLVLFELGLLDDNDDWSLYVIQENRREAFEGVADADLWNRYVTHTRLG